MNENSAEFVEIFLQEASDRLQYLREYSTILLDAYPDTARSWSVCTLPHTPDWERLLLTDFLCFAEVAGKLAHIFQYAMNASIAPEAAAP